MIYCILVQELLCNKEMHAGSCVHLNHMKKGFDNEKYLATQSRCIRERIDKFGDKLYLEFGGKLFDDYHASRVLPGFEPDSKLQLLMQLSEHAEIVIVTLSKNVDFLSEVSLSQNTPDRPVQTCLNNV